jgi:hypothetical protein
MKTCRSLVGAVAAAAAALLIAAPVPAQATTGTWVWSNPIAHVYQDTPYNCLPATAQNMLASAGYNVSQDTLASEFGTVEAPGGGSGWSRAVGPLDQIVSGDFKTFDERYLTSATDLMTEVQYSINEYHAAVMVATVDGEPPWVNNPSDTTGHFVTIYGYNTGESTSSGGAFYVWDPETGRGYEWTTVDGLYAALQTLNDPYTGQPTAHAVYEMEEQ